MPVSNVSEKVGLDVSIPAAASPAPPFPPIVDSFSVNPGVLGATPQENINGSVKAVVRIDPADPNPGTELFYILLDEDADPTSEQIVSGVGPYVDVQVATISVTPTEIPEVTIEPSASARLKKIFLVIKRS